MSSLHQDTRNRILLYTLISLGVFIHLASLGTHFISDDSGLYALLSRNMADSGNWYRLHVYGKDWLDKPHFQFWVTAPFVQVFGHTSLAYRLPSLIFFFLGLLFTYKIGRMISSDFVGLTSVLILLTTQHIFISSVDVRAETILLGLITPSMYYLLRLKDEFRFKFLFLASVFSACAIMTKGLVVLVPAFMGFFFYFLMKKEFKSLMDLKWLLFALLTFFFLAPEFYALYLQFDSLEGIRWFLWDSQFGRFLGEGPISRPESNLGEYWLNLCWAMFPWVVLFFPSLYLVFKKFKNKTLETDAVLILASGSLGTMLLFSLSSFQLPHYTNILYPFCALVIAYCVVEIDRAKYFLMLIKGLLVGVFLLCGVLGFFDLRFSFLLIIVIIFLSAIWKFLDDSPIKLVICTSFLMVSVNLGFWTIYGAKVLSNKPEQEIATFINTTYPKERVVLFDLEKISHRFAYFLDSDVVMADLEKVSPQDKYQLVLVQDKWDDVLRWNGNKTQLLKSWEYNPSENLFSLLFKDEGTEPRKWFLVRVNP